MKLTAISNLKGGLHHAAGLNVHKLVALKNHYGDDFMNRYQGAKRIDKEDIYKLKTDVLFLCGRSRAITKNRVDELDCKIICPAANNPLEDGIEDDIQKRDILYIPDFVANSGGSCCTFLYLKGVGIKQMKRHYLRKEFSDLIQALIVNAQRAGKSPSHFALHVASRNLKSAGSNDTKEPKKLARFQRRLQRSAPKHLLTRPFLQEIKRSMRRNIALIEDPSG